MEFRHEYGRAPPVYRGSGYSNHRDFRGIENRSNEFLEYARSEYQQQRPRSHTRLDPEFIPSEFFNKGHLFDKSLRSKSLDHRDAFGEESQTVDRRRGINIPIYRERNSRNYDYERNLYTPFVRKEDKRNGHFDTTGRNEVYSHGMDMQMKRVPRMLTRSNEWLARCSNDDRPRNPRDLSKTEGYSPKSASSSKRHNLSISIDPGRGRRDNGRLEEYIDYGRGDGREMYFGDERHMNGNIRGAAQERKAQSTYHYESRGGFGGTGGGFQSQSRRTPTTQQLHYVSHGTSTGVFRPTQHHQVKCCCFNFIWPPWSYEVTEPPQPLYRNI